MSSHRSGRLAPPAAGPYRRPVRRYAISLLVLAAAGCATEPTGPVGPESPPLVCGSSAVSVPVGTSVRPAAGSLSCRLAAESGAEYALAVLDAQPIEDAELTWESVLSDYVVTLTVGGSSAAAATGLALRGASGAGALDAGDVMDAERTGEPSGSPADRDRPWNLGERFWVIDDISSYLRNARVLRIYDERYVVAWFENGDSTRLSTWLPRLDSAFPVVRQHAFPLLRSTFVDAAPTTSARSGQYLILLRDTLGSYAGYAYSVAAGDTVSAWVYLKVDTAYQTTGLASLLAHEMTHSYQRMYMHATRGLRATSRVGAATWGTEGGANLLSYETMRRSAGLPLDGNYDWRAPDADAAARHVARRAQPATGEFTAGYDNAMGFLRRLVVQLVRSGATVDAAVRTVARGAVEGWYGYDGITHRTGLASRMRALLDYRWDPAEALLDWTLSHAADDLTDDPEFQDRTSLRVWDIPAGTAGWRASATLTSAQPDQALVERRYGSPFFAYLLDGGSGITLDIAAYRNFQGDQVPSPPPQPIDVRWKLVRIR